MSVPEAKVWQSGAWIVACAGDWRASELIRYTVKFPAPPTRISEAHKVVCVDVFDEIRRAFAARGFDPAADDCGTAMLLGVRTSETRTPILYRVEDEHAERHTAMAVGFAEDFALGALAAQPPTLSPDRRIQNIMRTTRAFYGNIRPPYRVESL
jgi:hypothetical protein